jgi:NAD-dependent deacetylase
MSTGRGPTAHPGILPGSAAGNAGRSSASGYPPGAGGHGEWSGESMSAIEGMPESEPTVLALDSRLVRVLRAARRVSVLTGAGVSAESGIPTFRGADGLWKNFRPEELANIDAFMANPERVWEWYRFRREIVRKAEPNPAHRALVDWERKVEAFTLITQNVDGLHARAGSRRLVELHGNLERDRCLDCGARRHGAVDGSDDVVPVCRCGGRMRPDVVWFGELLPAEAMADADRAAATCDLFLAVGTSAVVQPAASLPRLARHRGAVVVEVNAEPTPVSEYADFTLYGEAGRILPRLVECLDS